MQLLSLLIALSQNKNLYITLKDEDGHILIKFEAPGYESVENDLGIRVVKEVNIFSPNAATIVIESGGVGPTPSGASAFVYSTEEKAVGTWINGKTLYQVTRVLENMLHIDMVWSYISEFSDIEDLENVVSCEVWPGMKGFDYYFVTNAISEMGRPGVCIRTRDQTIVLHAGDVITIRYYKSSD